MKTKLGLLVTIAIAAIMMTAFHSVAMADPEDMHYDHKQMNPERMHEHMKARLDKLAERLEIKSSQQGAWEAFSKSVEMLADRAVKNPNEDADAAAIASYRAESATEFARKLTAIADATAKLQAVLTEDQRKLLNQESRRYLHMEHGWNRRDHGMDHEGHGHGWGHHGDSGGDEHHKDSWQEHQ
jgi:phage protein D